MPSTKQFNRVRASTATSGTGTMTLGAATSNFFMSLLQAGAADGDVVSYLIEQGTDFEIGFGTVGGSSTTVTRTVRVSRIGGTVGTSKIDLNNGGTPVVMIDIAKEDNDVNDFDEEAAPDPDADYIWMHDASAVKRVKVKPRNLILGLSQPNARLTLVSATPVLSSNQTAKTTIFLTVYPGPPGATAPSDGIFLPLYDGVKTRMVPIGGEKNFILNTTSHTSGNLYDLFWDDTTSQLVTGPAWTSATARNEALAYRNGFPVNDSSMTAVITNSTSTVTVAANRGLYLGTIRTTANGQTGMNFNPTPASGGTNNILGLYNAFNKVLAAAQCIDAVSDVTLSQATWRALLNSASNAINYVDGLGDVAVWASVNALYLPGTISAGGEGFAVGINRDSTTATPAVQGAMWMTSTGVNFGGEAHAIGTLLPSLGYHTINAVEVGYNTNAVSVYGSGFTGGFGNLAGLQVFLSM